MNNCLFTDNVEEYKEQINEELSFLDLISYDAINIFEYKIYNTDTTEEDFYKILEYIFNEDKVEFLELLLNKNLVYLDMLFSFFVFFFSFSEIFSSSEFCFFF